MSTAICQRITRKLAESKSSLLAACTTCERSLTSLQTSSRTSEKVITLSTPMSLPCMSMAFQDSTALLGIKLLPAGSILSLDFSSMAVLTSNNTHPTALCALH